MAFCSSCPILSMLFMHKHIINYKNTNMWLALISNEYGYKDKSLDR